MSEKDGDRDRDSITHASKHDRVTHAPGDTHVPGDTHAPTHDSEQISEQDKGNKPGKKPRSKKQIEWSRKLGQRSKEIKRQKIENESMLPSDTQVGSKSVWHAWYILIPIGLGVYIFYLKHGDIKHGDDVHEEVKENNRPSRKEEYLQEENTTKYSMSMN